MLKQTCCCSFTHYWQCFLHCYRCLIWWEWCKQKWGKRGCKWCIVATYRKNRKNWFAWKWRILVLYGYKRNHEHNELNNQHFHEWGRTQNVLIDKKSSDHNNSTRHINLTIEPVMLDESSTYTAGASIWPNINTNRVETALKKKLLKYHN